VIHPMGAIITELRNASIASGRVRGGEPAQGDAKAAGSFQRFVVLVSLGSQRLHRAPMAIYRIGVRAYAATFQDAAALYGEISDVLDNAGPRLSASLLPIYQSLDDAGSGASKDPQTGQPYEEGVIEVHAGTAVLAGS
jgi:hypothetical protein